MLALIDRPAADQHNLQMLQTPFGPAHYRLTTVPDGHFIELLREQGRQDPRAIAYAARKLGATRVISVIRDAHVRRPVSPADFIEFTSGRPTTFFETIGAGYLQQDPPFCPELRQELLSSAVEPTGVLLVVDARPSPAVCAWWEARHVQAISVDSQPEGILCRELELCHAVLAVPPTGWSRLILGDLVSNLPVTRGCACSQTMDLARKLGKLPPDWFTKLGGDR